MKKLYIIVAAALMAVLPLRAQNDADEQFEYEFNPHWFIQGQFGGQYTLGEVSFKDLLSLDAQLAVGYKFTPVVAGRLAINAWQSKGGVEGKYSPNNEKYLWSWNYVTPALDAMFDLSNLFGGFKPRKVSTGVFAGIGLNIPFGKDKVTDTRDDIVAEQGAAYAYANNNDPNYIKNEVMPWADDKGPYVVGRAGFYVDWNITDNLALGLELQANTLSDKYNSKDANNWDWYFNGLVGIKYCFGNTYTKKPAQKMIPLSDAGNYVNCPEPTEKIVEKVVDRTVEVVKNEIYEEIYFIINKSDIQQGEKYKVRRIVDFLNENPDAKVDISAHADRATGTSAYNQKLSERRAESVKKALIDAGISESRITTSAYGSSQNKYSGEDMKLNRVCICVAK